MNLHQISAEYELNITPDGKIRGPLLAGATSKALFSQVSDEDLNLALKYFEISQQKNGPSFNKVTFTEKLSQVKQQDTLSPAVKHCQASWCIGCSHQKLHLPCRPERPGT